MVILHVIPDDLIKFQSLVIIKLHLQFHQLSLFLQFQLNEFSVLIRVSLQFPSLFLLQLHELVLVNFHVTPDDPIKFQCLVFTITLYSPFLSDLIEIDFIS